MNFAKILAENKVKILTQRDKNQFVTLTKQINTIDSTDLQDIKGVGEATIKKLLENNIKTQDDLLSLGVDGIKKLKLNFISEKALITFIKK